MSTQKINSVKIFHVDHFNMEHTFSCGQCFRWNKDEYGRYSGIAFGQRVLIDFDGDITLHGATENSLDVWKNYFDMQTDYGQIKNAVNCDNIMNACIRYGYGIRLLRQQPWEVIVSFIISSNNNIVRIKKIIEKFCQCFGEKIDGGYSFPSWEVVAELSVADLKPIAAGFRDKYIIDAAKKIKSGNVDLPALAAAPTSVIKEKLLTIKGVGDKVADCVLLFGFARREVFPKDVWIKRICDKVYSVSEKDINAFAKKKFGNYQGFAQQYLYKYYQNNKML